MSFSFTATIYKVGINPCVPVPKRITDKMLPAKGFIPVKGKINGHSFVQTLVPIKDEEYRLYVNGPMLKGGNAKNGDAAKFVIEQNLHPEIRDPKMLPQFKKRLTEERLMNVFKKLKPSRRKEILKYMGFLKTEESVQRNIVKVIAQLKQQQD
ncbi:MAG: YdeI/OmpD-associated family protein [Bacteroidota bacterium]